MLLIDGLDLTYMSSFAKENTDGGINQLITRASVASLNCRVADTVGKSRAAVSGSLTFGAGKRALGVDDAYISLGKNDSYDEYMLRGGKASLYNDKTLFNLGFFEQSRINLESNYSAVAGNLGETLKNAGIDVTVIGNSDTSTKIRRSAPNMVMDVDGIVQNAYVNNESVKDESRSPGGKIFDVDGFRKLVSTVEPTGLVVIEYADILRLLEIRSSLSDEAFVKEHKNAYKRLDEALKVLYDIYPPNDDTCYIVATSVAPSTFLPSTSYLGSIYMEGAGYGNHLLVSATTKRRGIVANIDIAPTIASLFDTELLFAADGRLIIEDTTNLHTFEAQKLYQDMSDIWRARTPSLKFFLTTLFGLLIFWFIYIVFLNERLKKRLKNVFDVLTLLIVSMPVALIVQPLVNEFLSLKITTCVIVFEMMVLSSTITVLSIIIAKKTKNSLAIIALFTVLVISLDNILNGELALRSVLSYSPVSGSRYYGIGNEYMGIMIGALLVFLSRLKINIKLERKVVLGSMLITGLFLGTVTFGANFGGMATILIIAIIYSLILQDKEHKKKSFISVMFLVVMITYFVFKTDIDSKNSSHIGMSINSLSNGYLNMFNIVRRKIEMNMRLFTNNIWTKMICGFIFSLAIMMLSPVAYFRKLLKSNRTFYTTMLVAFIGSLITIFLNDSGTVACATLAFFPFMALLSDFVNS